MNDYCVVDIFGRYKIWLHYTFPRLLTTDCLDFDSYSVSDNFSGTLLSLEYMTSV